MPGVLPRPDRGAARRDRARRREVDLDGVRDVRRVAARERDADGRPGALGGVEDERVARAQAVLRQREAAEAIALPRVRARQEEEEVGAGDRNGLVERGRERAQVCVVAGAGGQVDVEVGGRAAERVVRAAVERERVAARVPREQLRRAVALVDVAVDDKRAAERAVGPQRGDRHDDVVEQAVAAALRVRRVVRAAAEVHAEASFERVARGVDRPLRRPAAALDELGRPREPERALLAPRELAAPHPREVVGVVHHRQQLPRGRLGRVHRPEALALDGLAQQAVLRQREPVAGGEREAVLVV
jgi:hypothetical protein